MNTTVNAVGEVVSERIGNITRLVSRGPLSELKQVEDAAIEARIGDGIQRLSLASAAALAAALGAALDHVRRENPALLSAQSLSAPEIELVLSAVQWVRILQAEGHSIDNVTHSGVERSMLLRRLRSGRSAFEVAPPTSFGQPWYEVMEADTSVVHKVSTDGKVTTLAELLGTLDASATARSQLLVSINGCHWSIVETKAFGTHFIVRYQGHETLFELMKNDGPDGAVWTLRKGDRSKKA